MPLRRHTARRLIPHRGTRRTPRATRRGVAIRVVSYQGFLFQFDLVYPSPFPRSLRSGLEVVRGMLQGVTTTPTRHLRLGLCCVNCRDDPADPAAERSASQHVRWKMFAGRDTECRHPYGARIEERSEEHTSELQSPCNLVCRLLLEKKKEARAALPRVLL